MRLIDLTATGLEWLKASQPVDEFVTWLEAQDDAMQVAFSWLARRPDGGFDKASIAQRVDRLLPAAAIIENSVRGERFRRSWASVAEVAARLAPNTGSGCEVYMVVGLGRSNASSGFHDGRGMAFVFVESFLEPGTEARLLNLGLDALPVSTAHEIGHAIRYALPGSRSLVPVACGASPPHEFWARLDELPLTERFLDEGLATRFQMAALGQRELRSALLADESAFAWLQAHSSHLLQTRALEWDLRRWHPNAEWIDEALEGIDATDRWSVAEPPRRWGYYIGCIEAERHLRQSPDWPVALSFDHEDAFGDLPSP